MARVTMNDESPPPEPKRPAPPYARRGMSLGKAWFVFAFAGIAYLAAAALKVVVHQPEGPLFAGCGVAFLVVAWFVKPKGPAAAK
jgi:hypothetical protein